MAASTAAHSSPLLERAAVEVRYHASTAYMRRCETFRLFIGFGAEQWWRAYPQNREIVP
jgi:hypothetical protein